MLKEICCEKPELKAAYERLTDEQKEKAEIGCYMIERALNNLIPFIENTIKEVQEFLKTIINTYPNKRVVHLALHGKGRTCKKNIHRIYNWFNKEANNGGK